MQMVTQPVSPHINTSRTLFLFPKSVKSVKMQVLLLGGHGKVALHLTPLLLKRAWNVTSVIRNPAHESEILELGKGLSGNLKVLVSSLEDVKSAADAQSILEKVSPDYVVWSAGRDPHLSITHTTNTPLRTHPRL